jgi:hypothetical protein
MITEQETAMNTFRDDKTRNRDAGVSGIFYAVLAKATRQGLTADPHSLFKSGRLSVSIKQTLHKTRI